MKPQPCSGSVLCVCLYWEEGSTEIESVPCWHNFQLRLFVSENVETAPVTRDIETHSSAITKQF